jgi:DNA-binding MarR family transcriptional regulator
LSTVVKNAADLSHDRCIDLARGIHRARAALVSHAEAFAQRNDLEGAHMSILHALGLGGEMRMSDLASGVVVGAATATRRAKQLEERGLVSRRRSDESQREVLISLTEKGEAMFEESFAHLHAEHRKYFDDRFTEEEQGQLQALFQLL